MNYSINKTFTNGEYIMNQVRAFGRTMFSINLKGNYSNKTRLEITDTISEFIKNGKKKEVMEVINCATSMTHLLGLIESAFMTKYIKVKKVRVKKIKIKVGKKVTDIAVDEFRLCI